MAVTIQENITPVTIEITPIVEEVTVHIGGQNATIDILDSENTVLHTRSFTSGGVFTQVIGDSNYIVKNTNGDVIDSGSVVAQGSKILEISDSVLTIKDADLNVLYTVNLLAEVSGVQTIQDSVVTIKNTALATIHSVSVNAQGIATQQIADSVAVLKNTLGSILSSNNIIAEASADITAPNATVTNSNATYSASVASGGNLPLPDITVTDSDGSTYPKAAVQNVVCTPQVKILFWELNFNGTDDVIFVPATVNNVGTLTSGTGTNVGTITISTDGVTYGALTFPFVPVNGTTYYFKRSTATVSGLYTMTGTYA